MSALWHQAEQKGVIWQEEWSMRFETDFGETAAEASTAAADHGRAPVPELSMQDIDAAIDKEMASPQVMPPSWTSCLPPCVLCVCRHMSTGGMTEAV